MSGVYTLSFIKNGKPTSVQRVDFYIFKAIIFKVWCVVFKLWAVVFIIQCVVFGILALECRFRTLGVQIASVATRVQIISFGVQFLDFGVQISNFGVQSKIRKRCSQHKCVLISSLLNNFAVKFAKSWFLGVDPRYWTWHRFSKNPIRKAE